MTEGLALVGAGVLMGAAGLPHCVAMCSAPCALVAPASPGRIVFQVARVAGYAAAGALAAASVGLLREGLLLSASLRPLWTLLHLLALAVALWLLWRGRWPAWLRPSDARPGTAVVMAPRPRRWRAAAAGAAWIAWPCALSQSALVVAALASTPAQGGAVMAGFALASSPALWFGPALLRRSGRSSGAATAATWPVRATGGLLAAGSAWALGHGLWPAIVAACGL